jgi:KUP system potassium uptake protein
MNKISPDAVHSVANASHGHSGGHRGALSAAMLGALGVVYGDIGTSPLYALKTALSPLGQRLDQWEIMGVLSLIFWALTLIVSVKYVLFVLRADNEGEGGILALMSLLNPWGHNGGKARPFIALIGLFGCTLLMGDGIITPAISVLSAVEGLQTVAPSLEHVVIPVSIVILIALFAVQSRGTHQIAKVFGPIMLLWFLAIGALGVAEIIQNPVVLQSVNPVYAVTFIFKEKTVAFAVFGAVFLAVTGGEAMYADLGHCGRSPIRSAWFAVVFPALILNYFGQGALMLADPDMRENPFFNLAPESLRLPLVILATAATVIASQALISGVFSLTRQAIQLGFSPRFKIKQTYANEFGQIYVPMVNWALMVGAVLLIAFFKTSDNMAAAYGIAVVLTMLITTLLVACTMRSVWKWNWLAVATFALFFTVVDGVFAASNLLKITDGGWVPLSIGLAAFIAMSTWAKGADAVRNRLLEMSLPLDQIVNLLKDDRVCNMGSRDVARVPGTKVFMTKTDSGLPPVLCQYLQKTRSVPENVVILHFHTARTPFLHRAGNISVDDLGHGFWRVNCRYGFMQMPNVMAALKEARMLGLLAPLDGATIVTGTEIPTRKKDGSALGGLQFAIYAWMLRNSTRASLYFRLPKEQTLEFGLHLEV